MLDKNEYFLTFDIKIRPPDIQEALFCYAKKSLMLYFYFIIIIE